MKMVGFKKLTPVRDALEMIYRGGLPELGSESIATVAALGRVLGEDVVSDIDVPPFDRTAVDGFAIKSQESFSASRNNPAVFSIKGCIEAGDDAKGRKWFVGPGEAYEVYTGSPIPKGSDAVVMAEDARRCNGKVEVYRAVPRMSNISPRGEDIRAREILLKGGTLIRPWHIGALASVGMKTVAVRKRARVGIFSTGTELVDLGGAEPPGNRIVDSTRPMIIASLETLGCAVVDGGIIEDRLESIESSMENLYPQVDVLISIGGTSVGGKDLVPDAVLEVSGRIIFHGLAIKPGKPTGYAIIEGKPLFMLPGYPVSALVGFEAVIEPVLCKMMGRGAPQRATVKARISRRVPTTPGIRHYLRVVLRASGNGLVAEPITITGSGLLSSVTRADGIVVIGEDLEGVEEGEEVEVELLGGFADV